MYQRRTSKHLRCENVVFSEDFLGDRSDIYRQQENRIVESIHIHAHSYFQSHSFFCLLYIPRSSPTLWTLFILVFVTPLLYSRYWIYNFTLYFPHSRVSRKIGLSPSTRELAGSRHPQQQHPIGLTVMGAIVLLCDFKMSLANIIVIICNCIEDKLTELENKLNLRCPDGNRSGIYCNPTPEPSL